MAGFPVGTVRRWGGKMMRKEATKWVEVVGDGADGKPAGEAGTTQAPKVPQRSGQLDMFAPSGVDTRGPGPKRTPGTATQLDMFADKPAKVVAAKQVQEQAKQSKGPGKEPEVSGEYAAAHAAVTAATRAFRDAEAAYRSRKIGDAEYLAARKKYEAAQITFDAAHAKEAAAVPKAPEPAKTPEAPKVEPPKAQSPAEVLADPQVLADLHAGYAAHMPEQHRTHGRNSALDGALSDLAKKYPSVAAHMANPELDMAAARILYAAPPGKVEPPKTEPKAPEVPSYAERRDAHKKLHDELMDQIDKLPDSQHKTEAKLALADMRGVLGQSHAEKIADEVRALIDKAPKEVAPEPKAKREPKTRTKPRRPEVVDVGGKKVEAGFDDEANRKLHERDAEEGKRNRALMQQQSGELRTDLTADERKRYQEAEWKRTGSAFRGGKGADRTVMRPAALWEGDAAGGMIGLHDLPDHYLHRQHAERPKLQLDTGGSALASARAQLQHAALGLPRVARTKDVHAAIASAHDALGQAQRSGTPQAAFAAYEAGQNAGKLMSRMKYREFGSGHTDHPEGEKRHAGASSDALRDALARVHEHAINADRSGESMSKADPTVRTVPRRTEADRLAQMVADGYSDGAFGRG